MDALRFGLRRDYPKKVTRFDRTRIEFVYYGDVNNAFLVPEGHDLVTDAAGRRKTLRALQSHRKADFNKTV
ncbi:MAG: hypothetical protein OEN01_02110, partial [Candidatus Krumholzibacteria bacterium]|nr:hypothetical protein [Candidatus Krumholzibacteria bacterium]